MDYSAAKSLHITIERGILAEARVKALIEALV